MPSKLQVTFNRQNYTKLYPAGTLIHDILKLENINIPLDCNGQGTCGKCLVKVYGSTSAPTLEESEHLTIADMDKGFRLACQTKILGPVILDTLEDQHSQNVLLEGYLELADRDPLWGKIAIQRPSIVSWEGIKQELPFNLRPTLTMLHELASIPMDCKELTVEYFADEAIRIGALNNNLTRYAVAVDIGTTTLAGYLIDFSKGEIIATASGYNSQAKYGADVISRINYAGNEDGLIQLSTAIINQINQMIAQFTVEKSIGHQELLQINLVGNSCMTHLLLKLDPANLGKVPFEPIFKSMIELRPEEAGFQINRQGKVFVLPGIGGFVGSDITAGVLACRLGSKPTELFIDIGTNGEVVLHKNGRMLACSTAAGPSFEGATISCGMLAKAGAIIDLQITTDNVLLTTINQERPRGICGTGLIRILVELLKHEYILESGRWADQINHPNFEIAKKQFLLYQEDSQSIYISQQDIRQFQLAKGAIRTGLELLMNRMNVRADEIDVVYLAGAFGTYLKPEDAVFLGLLPDIPLDRIKAVGNTAGMGAVISVLSKTSMDQLSELAGKIEHIELAEDPQFTEVFTESMLFSM